MSAKVKSDIGRFAIVPEWLLEQDLSAHAIRLFAVLGAKYADRDTLTARPSRRRLAEDLQASLDTVDRAIKALEEVGAITTLARLSADGDPTSSLYTLHLVRPGEEVPVPVERLGGRTPAATPSKSAATGGRTPAATGGRTRAAQYPESTSTQNHVEPEGDVARARATPEELWVDERRRHGVDRFTDPAALRELGRRIQRALTAGATADDVERALRAHAGEPRASVYYADEWIAEVREDRERHEHERRKQAERDETRSRADAAATRQQAALLARHPGLTLAEALEVEGVTHPSLRRRVAS